jgi:hypothetical protein
MSVREISSTHHILTLDNMDKTHYTLSYISISQSYKHTNILSEYFNNCFCEGRDFQY